MKKTLLMAALAAAVVGLSFGCGGNPSVSTFKDSRDGKVYKIVQIGSQVWFAENLNYAAEGSKCYDNKDANCAKYGRLYDWNTAMKACPVGTHLPTDKEWTILVDYVGGDSTAGTKLKSSKGWGCENVRFVPEAGTNEYGFSALPGGRGLHYGKFSTVGNVGIWWSATEDDDGYARCLDMYYYLEGVGWGDYYKTNRFSVRCVLDNGKERRK